MRSVIEKRIRKWRFRASKGQISPRGPTMVGRGVCSPRGQETKALHKTLRKICSTKNDSKRQV